MESLIKKNAAFFIPYLLFLISGAIALISWNKTEIHLFINGYHCPAADVFFPYWTYLGLGAMIIPVGIVLAFIRLRYVIISFLGFALSGLVNDSIKAIFHTPRPLTVFTELHQSIYSVPHVDVLAWNSFPSGHSATGFCMFCLLTFYSKNKWMKFFFFMIAFLIGYSRMYLSEHFLIDVYAGSIIGVVSAIVCYNWIMNSKFFNKFTKVLDKPLFAIKKT